MRLVGANASAAATGADELPGKSNYFIGNDPKKWRTNVPNYAKVKYQNVYPGVDLVYYGNQSGQLEYDFVVDPGADPATIRFALSGGLEVGSRQSAVGSGGQSQATPQSKIQNLKSKIDASGDLVIKTDGGEVRFHKPLVYQPAINNGQRTTDDGQRTTIDGRYVLQANDQVGLKIASYDHSKALFIDPVLSYSTYLGGSGIDEAYGIAVDSAGNAYVTGQTGSPNFPMASPFQPALGGPSATNAFVTELNATGTALVYSTYLGGSAFDVGFGIAVDSTGNAYVTGLTRSINFPTASPFQATCGSCSFGNGNAFVTKLNAAGNALIYSTYLGGNAAGGFGDQAFAIAVDSTGNAYVTGYTGSTNFPTSLGAFQTTLGALIAINAFVTKFNALGALIYSTYLGGNDEDIGNGIAVDSAGNAYVTGRAFSSDFPTTPGAFQTTLAVGASFNAFVTRFNAAGTALAYSTYLGGSAYDYGNGIAVDSSGNAYVTGHTASSNFPTTPSAFQTTFAVDAEQNAFVTKLNATGSALVYSTYLGGSGDNEGFGIAVDSAGNAYVTGQTDSINFPTASPIQTALGGPYATNAFVTNLNAAGTAPLDYSTYLGGSFEDEGNGIAVDSCGNAYVTGYTTSTNFPTANPLQATNHGSSDAFVAKISSGMVPCVSFSPTNLTFGAQSVGSPSAPQTETVTNIGAANLIISTVTLGGTNSGDFATSADTCTGATVTPSSTCTLNVTFTPTAAGSRSASLNFTDNASNSPQSVSLTGTGAAPMAGVSPPSLTFGNQDLGTTSASQPVTLSNTGAVALTLTSITASANFGETDNCGGSVAPNGGSCTINVSFSPSLTATAGALAGTLTITDDSNGAAGSMQTVSLSGTATSSGGGGLPPASVTDNEMITVTDTFPDVFDPEAITLTDQVTVTATNNTPPGTGVTVSLPSSPGVPPVSVTFANVTTAGNTTVTASTACMSGPPNFSVGTAGGAGECVDVSTTAVYSGTITITLNFNPANYPNPPGPSIFHLVGGSWVNVTVSVNYTNDTIMAQVTSLSPFGIFVALPAVSLSGTSQNFGSVLVDASSSAEQVTLTNNGGANLVISTAALNGPNASDFAISADTCSGTTLTPSNTCSVSVTFTPSAEGSRSASLIFTDNASDSPQTVALSGTGIEIFVHWPGPIVLPPRSPFPVPGPGQPIRVLPPAPIVTAPISVPVPTPMPAPVIHLTSSPLAFSAQGVGTSSHAQTVTLTNTGNVSLTISGITSSGDFSQTNTCPTTLSAGADCTISVTFTPVAAGTRTGTLSISGDPDAGPQTVKLSGTGLVSTGGLHPPVHQPQPVKPQAPN